MNQQIEMMQGLITLLHVQNNSTQYNPVKEKVLEILQNPIFVEIR